MPPAVHYRVAMPRPHAHLFEVEATFPAGPDVLDAVLPVWTPGSYLVREYARQVQDVSATTPDGRDAPVRRVDKRTWRVDARGQSVTLRYRVYANELTVRTSHLDGSHGYFNGATVFLYTEGTRHLPHHVSVDAPPGWRTFCALDSDGDTFHAPDYDVLVDSPFEVGPHTPLEFTAAGVPHQVVVWGDSVPDPERLCADLQRICEAQARMYGGLPLTRYLFLVYLTDKGRGGLEHQASTALLFPRTGLSTHRSSCAARG
jgi:predicted metalloprotease with PDZ domain